MKKFIKRLMFLLFLVSVGLALYSWTGFWIPKDSSAILYDSQENSYQIAERFDIKDWTWKRLIPNRTKLYILQSGNRKIEQQVHFYLPNAQYYSSLLNISEESFSVDLSVSLFYNINLEKLSDYLSQYYQTSSALNGNDIINTIEHKIDISVSKKIRYNILENLENFYASDWENDISQLLQNTITPIEELPIEIVDIDFEVISTPDLASYQLVENFSKTGSILNNSVNNEKTDSNSIFTENAQWLNQYLFLIRELGKITKESPGTVEIIKALPPTILQKTFENN